MLRFKGYWDDTTLYGVPATAYTVYVLGFHVSGFKGIPRDCGSFWECNDCEDSGGPSDGIDLS